MIDQLRGHVWVVWEEGGRYPNVIIELLSDSTAAMDRGEKKQVYEQVFRTPEYFLFDPHSGELEGFQLVAGHYTRIAPDAHGRLRSEQLDLSLGVLGNQLRMYTADGTLLATPEEAADQAQQRAELEHQRAEQERLRAELERRRADEAEAELARLRAQVRNRD